MLIRILRILSLSLGAFSLLAQQRVDRGALYHRVYAVVPLVGQGTGDDPQRPMFAPQPDQPPSRNGIIAFQFVVSDDGTMALAEFVAVDRGVINGILHSNNPNIKAFEVGVSTPAQIEVEFRKYKTNFSFQNFQPLRVQ